MVTALQEQMLAKIILNDFTPLNGNEPEDYSEVEPTWADMVIDTQQDKGTFTSLVNAGMAFHEGKGRDAIIGVTQKGYDAYKTYASGKYTNNGRPIA